MRRKRDFDKNKVSGMQVHIPNKKTQKAILEGRRLARKKNVMAFETMEELRASLGL